MVEYQSSFDRFSLFLSLPTLCLDQNTYPTIDIVLKAKYASLKYRYEQFDHRASPLSRVFERLGKIQPAKDRMVEYRQNERDGKPRDTENLVELGEEVQAIGSDWQFRAGH